MNTAFGKQVYLIGYDQVEVLNNFANRFGQAQVLDYAVNPSAWLYQDPYHLGQMSGTMYNPQTSTATSLGAVTATCPLPAPVQEAVDEATGTKQNWVIRGGIAAANSLMAGYQLSKTLRGRGEYGMSVNYAPEGNYSG